MYKDSADCPQRRGSAEVIATYKYVGKDKFTVFDFKSAAQSVAGSPPPESHRSGTAPRASSSHSQRSEHGHQREAAGQTSQSSNVTGSYNIINDPSELPRPSGLPTPTFPWWPEISLSGNGAVYHASTTRLTDGRHGLLIDPGAWSNLVGEKWAREVAVKAKNNGHQPSQKKMTQPFTVQGVGTGTNDAKWEVNLPIAVSDEEGTTKLCEYHAPTVSGEGSDLPALLGLESMSKNRAVLEMTDGQEYLTYPGAGGYKIDWSPGTKRYKLVRAPSGHLILPCDAFAQIVEDAGVHTPVTATHMENRNSPLQTTGVANPTSSL